MMVNAKEIGAKVKEKVQTAGRQLKDLEKELNVKERANELGARVKETVQTAQSQLASLEEEVTRFVGRVQERVAAGPAEGARKLEDLLRTVAVNDFIEKVRTIEMFKQGSEVRKELLERFGLASSTELTDLEGRLNKLTGEVASLKRKLGKQPKATQPAKETASGKGRK